MPPVSKHELLTVVRDLWGFKDAPVDEQAKQVLAEQLIREACEHGNKAGLVISIAGQCIKDALGSAWMSAADRNALGKPSLRQVLGQDPYFVVRQEEGSKQPAMVKLRISRLSKLIGNPELIAAYRAPPEAETSNSSHTGHAGPSTEQAVTLTDEGLPIRPGQRPCAHYMKFGWCLFKQDCWYSHPPHLKAGGRAGAGPPGNRDPPLFESELEPGVMLINGVNPVRPGRKVCQFFLSNGWCTFKTNCRNHHPLPSELAALQAQQPGPSSSRAGAISPASEDSFGGASSSSSMQELKAPMVKQPPLQVIMGVIIDSVWPPRESPEACARGAVAKFIVEQRAQEVQQIFRAAAKAAAEAPDDAHQEAAAAAAAHAEITVPGPAVGQALGQFWQRQRLYDPQVKPYKSLADLLDADPLFWANRVAQGTNTFTLRFGELITGGGRAASQSLAVMCDTIWPPTSGKDAWLRGTLAKWLLQAGFEGNNGLVLRQVLAVGPDSPTVFRIDVAQAGEYLRRCWASSAHPYDSSQAPWTQLKPLIAGDRFLCLEPAPGRPTSQHVTLDLLDMLRQLPKLARRSAQGTQQQGRASLDGGGGAPGSNGSSMSGPSSSSTRPLSAAASSSQAGPSNRRSSTPGDVLEVEGDNTQQAAAAAANPYGFMQQATTAAATATAAAGNGAQTSAPQQSVAGAEADVAALQALAYVPPAEGNGPRRLQRWWPENKPDKQGFVWAEIAVRLLSTSGPDATQRVAEMVQHLELCPILAVACSTYAQKPHMLQFFAPYASVGGLEMPAAVYLLDLHQPGPDVRNYLSLVAPVLSSRENIKICHSSKQWSGLLYKVFGLMLENYFDTQQANYVLKALLRETSKNSLADADLQRTTEVSLTALTTAYGFHHPVRHQQNNTTLQWQNRPLTNTLVTCAAADVAYLIPVMESQVRNICQAANAARQHQGQQRGRAATLLSSLPADISSSSVLDALARGVEGQHRGGISIQRLGEWASMSTFHQEPWHRING